MSRRLLVIGARTLFLGTFGGLPGRYQVLLGYLLLADRTWCLIQPVGAGEDREM